MYPSRKGTTADESIRRSIAAACSDGGAVKASYPDAYKEGELDLIGSYTLDYEISRNPYEMRKQSIVQFLQENMKGYVGIERAEILQPMAEEIMRTGVKEKDAYHLASAIYAGCEYFISTDQRLLKYKSEKIRLATPIEFVTETEGEE